MKKTREYLTDEQAKFLGFNKINNKRTGEHRSRYMITEQQKEDAEKFDLESKLKNLELKKQTFNKNGEVISETYSKKQTSDDIDTSKFLPISFTTNPFGDGKWTKYDLPNQDRLKALRTAIDELKKDITPVKKSNYINKTLKNDKLTNQYTLTDYHLGMMAWAEETGNDWDLKIAEDTLVSFFEQGMERSGNAENAIFAQIGDFLHWDGLEAVTPTSKHVLDADSRFTKLVRVAIRVIRRVIKMLLSKYKNVTVVMAEGNHDLASSVWLREVLNCFYEEEPRVIIDTNPDPYYCVTFGKVCLFYHHTHLKKIKGLDSVFVSKFKKEFGKSEFVYGHTGHYHHELKIESNLMIIEQHRTLAGKDAHSSRGGYSSGRDSKVITYHKDYGEIARTTININMLK